MMDKFNELLKLSSEKNYEFHFKISEEKENILNVDREKKIIDITIGDPDNKNLLIILDEIIRTL